MSFFPFAVALFTMDIIAAAFKAGLIDSLQTQGLTRLLLYLIFLAVLFAFKGPVKRAGWSYIVTVLLCGTLLLTGILDGFIGNPVMENILSKTYTGLMVAAFVLAGLCFRRWWQTRRGGAAGGWVETARQGGAADGGPRGFLGRIAGLVRALPVMVCGFLTALILIVWTPDDSLFPVFYAMRAVGRLWGVLGGLFLYTLLTMWPVWGIHLWLSRRILTVREGRSEFSLPTLRLLAGTVFLICGFQLLVARISHEIVVKALGY